MVDRYIYYLGTRGSSPTEGWVKGWVNMWRSVVGGNHLTLARVPLFRAWFGVNWNGVYLLSNTTIWWIDIYIIYYIESYMFPRLVMAIFRLYMKHLVSSVDKKNQLDVTFCILYFSSNSCSTCFGATVCPSSGADDVWLTVHRNSVWIRKTN